VFNFLLFLLFLLRLGLQLNGVFLAQIISYITLAITVGFYERKFIGFSFSTKWLGKMFLYGIAQLPGMLMFWYITTSNRYFLSFYVNLTQVAYYSVGYKVSIALAMIYTAFVAAWEPFVLSKLDRPDIQSILRLVLKYYVISLLFLGSLFTIFAQEIITIFVPASYLPGVPIVGIMVIRHILPGFATITSVGISIKKKPIIYTISLGIGVLASIAANITLTSRWGIYGAAFSEVIGMSFWAISAYLLSKSLYKVDWELGVVLKSIAGFICLAFASFLLFKSNLPWVAIIPIKLVVLAFFTLYITRFIEPDHRKLIFVTAPQMVYRKVLQRLGK